MNIVFIVNLLAIRNVDQQNLDPPFFIVQKDIHEISHVVRRLFRLPVHLLCSFARAATTCIIPDGKEIACSAGSSSPCGIAESIRRETNIVMGREDGDRTRTIKIVPYADPLVQLRFVVKGQQLKGFYRKPGTSAWNPVGTATLPAKCPMSKPGDRRV